MYIVHLSYIFIIQVKGSDMYALDFIYFDTFRIFGFYNDKSEEDKKT